MPFSITLVARGKDVMVEASARKDGNLEKSLISEKKAAETKGTTTSLPSALQFKDSHGTMYQSSMEVTLRYEKHGSHQTFEETLYIVEDCQPDVIMRRDISKQSLQSKDGSYPTHYGKQSKGKKSRQQQRARTSRRR